MSRNCVICGLNTTGMRHAKYSTCFSCIDKAIEFYLANKEDYV